VVALEPLARRRTGRRPAEISAPPSASIARDEPGQAEAALDVLDPLEDPLDDDPLDDEPEELDDPDEPDEDEPALSEDEPPDEPEEDDSDEDSPLPDFTVLLVEVLRESVR
jgi:hypothetical protein